MKRIIRCLLLAILIPSFFGCRGSSETTSPSNQAYPDTPKIISIFTDRLNGRIEVQVSAGEELRYVSIGRETDDDRGNSISAKIEDEQGTMLYKIVMGLDQNGQGHWLSEMTELDTLHASFASTQDKVYESYDMNGDAISFSYPKISSLAMDRLVARYKREELLDSSPVVSEIAEKLRAFDAYYSEHSNNSLHNNPDGSLLVSVLDSEDLAQQLSSGDDFRQQIKDPLKRTCWAALTCTSFKCKLGGVANPACVACAGVATACIIAEMACWFLGCDCCF